MYTAIPQAAENIWRSCSLRKNSPVTRAGRDRAALLAFAAFAELKHIILVDEDVDPFDLSEWSSGP